jgi:hypothetical protein
MAVRDMPFLKFFPNDWLADEKLRLCSLAARGLWIEMLCLMHKNAKRRGYLEHPDGSAITAEQLARVVGIEAGESRVTLRELEAAGVFSRTENGTIFSRRMADDEKFRAACSEAGKASARTRDRDESGRLKGSRQRSTQRKANDPTNGKPTTPPTADPTIAQPSEIRDQRSEKDIAASAAEPAEKKPRPRNPIFDALAEVTGADPHSNGSHIGKLSALLSKASPPYSPDDVREFARRWRELLPWAKTSEHPRLTLGVIEKHIYTLRAALRVSNDPPRIKRAADSPLLYPPDAPPM